MQRRLSNEERRTRTRAELVLAADRLFVEQGFHATSVDQVAEEAGYTKGAVYSNFASKEDLFLAVYEERVARGVEQVERALKEHGAAAGTARVVAERSRRNRTDELWVAAFVEFWAHVVRRPAARQRFVELHARALEPMIGAATELLGEAGTGSGIDPEGVAVAFNGMQLAIVMERLIRPIPLTADEASSLGMEMVRAAAAAQRVRRS